MAERSSKRARHLAIRAIQGLWAKKSGSGQVETLGVAMRGLAQEFGVESTVSAVAAEMRERGLLNTNPPKQPVHQKLHNPKDSAKDFYASWEWKELRYNTLKRYGPKCMLCGWTKAIGGDNCIVVDHIKPLRKFPNLALEPTNMQVLCRDCNMGKSYKAVDDFRPRS